MRFEQRLERPLSRLEHVILCLFVVALPLVEAPKNVFLWLFLLVWLGSSCKAHGFGRLPRLWDGVFVAMLGVPLISIVLSAPFPHVWKEWTDVAGYAFLGWSLARSRLDEKQTVWLLVAILLATLVGLMQGLWMLATDAKRVWLQLNSVGHVNHSALYGAGVGIMATGLALVRPQLSSRKLDGLFIAAAFAMFAAMVVFTSRGAFLAYAMGLGCLLLCLYRHWLRVAVIVAVAIGVGCVAQRVSFELGQHKNEVTLFAKSVTNIEQGNFTSERAQLAHTAIEMWRQRPWTGVGAANFSAVSPAMLEGWRRARGADFVAREFLFSSHAHNLYLNTLAERGALGELFILCLGALWGYTLWRRRPDCASPVRDQLCWVAGLAGGAVVFVGGLFNTTLHHEHGMLSMIGLGLLLNASERAVESKS